MDGVLNPLAMAMNQPPDMSVQTPMAMPPMSQGNAPINTQPGAAPSAQGSPQFDIIQTVQQLLQMPQYQQAQDRLNDVSNREKGVSQQMQDLAANQPKSAYQPNYEHGAGVGGALRNVGRGVLQGLSLTGPGAAISSRIYAPGQRAYEQKKEALAGELQSLKSEEETASEGVRAIGTATTGAAWSGRLTQGQEKINVSQERANTAAQKVRQDYAVQLQKLEQGSQKITIQEKQEKATEWYHKGLLDAYAARTAAGQDENTARIGANEDMKAAAQTSAWRKEHWFLNLIGAEPEGASVSAPSAGSPKPTTVQKSGQKPAAKQAAAGGPPKGATHIGTGPDGKKHYADSKGNDLGLVK